MLCFGHCCVTICTRPELSGSGAAPVCLSYDEFSESSGGSLVDAFEERDGPSPLSFTWNADLTKGPGGLPAAPIGAVITCATSHYDFWLPGGGDPAPVSASDPGGSRTENSNVVLIYWKPAGIAYLNAKFQENPSRVPVPCTCAFSNGSPDGHAQLSYFGINWVVPRWDQ